MSPKTNPPLLDARDPPAVAVINESGRSDILLLGDHAGNAIPASLGDLGVTGADRRRHIAWDLGVRSLGEHLAMDLDAMFVYQPFSRLVIDCNRDPGSATSVVEVADGTPVAGNVALSPAAREDRRVAIHEPYHAKIANEVARRKARGTSPVLIALHSFTPVLGEQRRPFHVGILHDRGDIRLSMAMLKRLGQETRLNVGDNEPYRMDDTDYTIPRHAYPNGTPYIEVEWRQDLLLDTNDVRLWASCFAGWLGDALATLP